MALPSEKVELWTKGRDWSVFSSCFVESKMEDDSDRDGLSIRRREYYSVLNTIFTE